MRVPVREGVLVIADDRVFVLVRVEVLESDKTCRDIDSKVEGDRVRVSDLVPEKLPDVVTTAVCEVVAVAALERLMVPVDD